MYPWILLWTWIHVDNGTCIIGDDSTFIGLIEVGLECKVQIGERLTVTDYCYITTAEHPEIRIGNDCMFASHNEIRCHDYHPIFDIRSGKRLNESRSITIEDHVWLAEPAILLAGSNVGSGSIIGA